MNFSFLILEFLKQQGSVPVPGFGTFYLKNTNAFVDADGENILPPGKEVAFKMDNSSADSGFARFIAMHKNIPVIDAEIEMKKQTNFWYSTLEKKGQFILENVGTFVLDDSKIIFTGKRTESHSPDFYGLEEINLSEIKKAGNFSKTLKNKDSYRFTRTVYWIVPLVLGILGLTYFGIAQPEKIFGKKSFENGLKKKPVQQIEKDSIKKDSATIVNPKVDSAKTDSLKTTAVAPVPVKKWTSKKYSNSKWKKSKKPQNR